MHTIPSLKTSANPKDKVHESAASRRGEPETRFHEQTPPNFLERAQLGLSRLTPDEFAHLQRTIGNQATKKFVSTFRQDLHGKSARQPESAHTAVGPGSDSDSISDGVTSQSAPVPEARESAPGSRHISRKVPRQDSILQRFGSQEHKNLGTMASGNAMSDINIGTDAVPEFLTYGEVVALAGDYFGSLAEIRDLAKDQTGRQKIRWTRWLAIDQYNGVAEPALSDDDKKAIKDHYYTLASANVTHFSAGGTANATYEGQHTEALRLAFQAGIAASQAASASGVKNSDLKAAKTQEAFAQHFLSDMFSGGHVRTERKSIKAWYLQNMPNSTTQIVAYMASHMHSYLVSNLPAYKHIFIPSEADIAVQIKTIGGKALDAFGLGDIVSLAWHNADSKGIDVVSDVDASGTAKPGGFKWHDVGDGNLNNSSITSSMTVAAMSASLAELQTAASMGSQLAAGKPPEEAFQSTLTSLKPFSAEKFIPREDPSGTNKNMVWEWQFMNKAMYDAVDEAVQTDVAQNIKAIAATQESPKKEALEDFVGTLEIIGIHALEVAVGQSARIAPAPNYGLYKDQNHPYYPTPQFQE